MTRALHSAQSSRCFKWLMSEGPTQSTPSRQVMLRRVARSVYCRARGSLSGCLVVLLSGCLVVLLSGWLVVWLQMSMLEVYMERVRDLLEGESSSSSGSKGKTAGMGSPSRPTLTSPTFKDDDGGKESLQIREVGNGQWVLTWIGDQSIPVEL